MKNTTLYAESVYVAQLESDNKFVCEARKCSREVNRDLIIFDRITRKYMPIVSIVDTFDDEPQISRACQGARLNTRDGRKKKEKKKTGLETNRIVDFDNPDSLFFLLLCLKRSTNCRCAFAISTCQNIGFVALSIST